MNIIYYENLSSMCSRLNLAFLIDYIYKAVVTKHDKKPKKPDFLPLQKKTKKEKEKRRD